MSFFKEIWDVSDSWHLAQNEKGFLGRLEAPFL